MKKFEVNFADDVFYIKTVITTERNARDYRFLLDTGASASVLNLKSAEQLGFDMNTFADQITMPIATASDFIFPKSVTLKSFEALGLALQGFSINVIDFPDDVDGVIGNDFLRCLKRFTIIYPDETQEASIEVG